MGMNFPNSPSTGQQWPSPAVAGQPVYRWDGTVWSSLGVQPSRMPVYTDGSSPMTAQLTLVGDPVNPSDAARKAYVDAKVAALPTNAMVTTGNQTITGGFSLTSYNAGTASGTFTPNAMNGNYQYLTNNSAFTLAAPAGDSALDILITNGASAGAITFSGYTVSASVGDALTTTSGNKFIISIRRINGVSSYSIKALQ
jgi:hypothetical protein